MFQAYKHIYIRTQLYTMSSQHFFITTIWEETTIIRNDPGAIFLFSVRNISCDLYRHWPERSTPDTAHDLWSHATDCKNFWKNLFGIEVQTPNPTAVPGLEHMTFRLRVGDWANQTTKKKDIGESVHWNHVFLCFDSAILESICWNCPK